MLNKINCSKKNILILNSNVKFKSFLKKFNHAEIKLCFVINKNKLIGTITDGDIRRSLINEISVNDKIEFICNKKPIKVFLHKKIKVNTSSLNERGIKFLPIVDNKNFYKGHIAVDELNNANHFTKIKTNTNNKFDVVIMAGGFGKRLLPITKKIPKPLVKIDGTPILKKILLNFSKLKQVNNIYILLHYKSKLIKKFVIGQLSNIDKKIIFLHEKKPLNTAGGLSLLKPHAITNDLLILNSDILINLDFEKFYNFHVKKKSFITICASKNQISIPYGVINISNEKVKYINEKPNISFWVNAGIYFMNAKVANFIKNNENISASDLIKKTIKKNKKVYFYPLYENWFDIGSKIDLAIANNYQKNLYS
jgi:dTDP-glucose pyrophosphorylase